MGETAVAVGASAGVLVGASVTVLVGTAVGVGGAISVATDSNAGGSVGSASVGAGVGTSAPPQATSNMSRLKPIPLACFTAV